MSNQILPDFTHLSVDQLYAVYLEIAHADWKWRRHAAYGTATPPPSHADFRPRSYAIFRERMELAQDMRDGDQALRGRLARQAKAYGVDVEIVLNDLRQAA